MLPRRIPTKPKRSTRWRSAAHCNFVRGFSCANCGETAGIEVAHVRLGSGAGIGQKPDDWNTASLCRDCHARQHAIGERTFWADYKAIHGQSVGQLIAELCQASPKARDIAAAKRERDL